MSATAALAKSMQQTKTAKVISAQPMIASKSLKHSRPTMGSCSFDMDDLAKASKQVEDSIAFPSIEWSFDDSESDDDSFSFELSTKRQCYGLVRSKGAAHLSTFCETQRCGSFGSLC